MSTGAVNTQQFIHLTALYEMVAKTAKRC